MIHSPEDLKRIEQTRTQLEAHNKMPRLKRLGARIMRNYPGYIDRELVRRFDMDQYSRITEDILRAIDSSARARGIMRPYVYLKDAGTDTTTYYSFLVSQERAHLNSDLLTHLADSEGVKLPIEPYHAGVYKTVAAKNVSDTAIAQGILLSADNLYDEVKLPIMAGTFEALPQPSRDNLEDFAAEVAFTSNIKALLNPFN